MSAKSSLEALQKALNLERQGQEFYIQAAGRTVDSKGKDMFRSLADDEVIHAAMIQRQIDALTQGMGWIMVETGEVEADLESPLFPRGKVELERTVQPDASDLDALLFALQIENDSFVLYAGQAKQAQDPNARQLYEYLADAERTHFNLIMLNYEHLNQLGSFV